MHFKKTTGILIGFSLCMHLTPSVHAIGLVDAYYSALEKNESGAMAEKQVAQAEERVAQAWGAISPQLSLSGSYLRQDAPGTALTSQLKPNQSLAKLTVVQPLFHGFRDFAALRALEAKRRASDARRRMTVANLYAQVAAVFYEVLGSEKELENLSVVLELTEQRSKDLMARVKIGRSRRSEWLANEAQLANLRAQTENAKLQIKQAREQFQLLTQMEMSTSLAEADDAALSGTASLDLYLSLLEKRPDIETQKESVKAQEEAVLIHRGLHYPSVDLTGNYYLHRSGILSDSKWDVGIVATLPLFQGGIYQSQVREAISGRQEQELLLAQVRRAAIKEIRSAFSRYHSSVLQYETLKKALQISEESYQLTNKEYKTGLVTNLDVIQSLNTFQETKRQWDRTRFEIKSAFAALQASVGQVPEKTEKRHP